MLSRGELSAGVARLRTLLQGGALPEHLLPDAQANLGVALSQVGQDGEASAAFEEALALVPDSGFSRYNLAFSLKQAGRVGEAELQYRLAAKYSKSADSVASAHNNVGNLLVDSGRRAEARAAYRAAIGASPRHHMSYNNLGNVLRDGLADDAAREAGLREAARCYLTATRLSPEYLEAYRNLGNLLKERPPWRRAAVRAYRTALRLTPRGGGRDVFLNLGEVLQWIGGHERAANTTFALAVERGLWQHAQQRPSHYLPHLRPARAWWDPLDLPSSEGSSSPPPSPSSCRRPTALRGAAAATRRRRRRRRRRG